MAVFDNSAEQMRYQSFARFFQEGNSLSQVFVTDERDKVFVTEDVENVDSRAWELMRQTGFCQPPKE